MNSWCADRDYCAAQKLIVAIAKIAFFNEWAGNQSVLAVRSSPRLVGFWGLAMDFAMTGGGWKTDLPLTSAGQFARSLANAYPGSLRATKPCHLPLASLALTFLPYASGESGCFARCLLKLQNQQAATTLCNESGPPSLRGMRCSAVACRSVAFFLVMP